MGRNIILFSAVLMAPVIFLPPHAKAQQSNFRQTQDAAMAAAGPEFQRTGFATMGIIVRPLKRTQSSGPFPPQPYQPSRSEPPALPASSAVRSEPGYNPVAAPDSEAVKTGRAIARDVTEVVEPAIPGMHDEHGYYLGPKDRDRTNYGDELEARSHAIFGYGNLGAEPARQQWMANQEQKAIANEINRSKALLYPVR